MASNFSDKLLLLTQVADTGSFFLDSSVTCTIVQTFVFEDSVLNVIAGFTSSIKVSSQCLTLGSSKIDCALYNIFDEIIRKLDSSVKHWNDTTCKLQCSYSCASRAGMTSGSALLTFCSNNDYARGLI